MDRRRQAGANRRFKPRGRFWIWCRVKAPQTVPLVVERREAMRSTRFLAALIVSATVFYCTFGADLPPGWKHVDVGAPPSPPGDASYDDQTEVYTLAGDGAAGLWMPAADAVHFAFKE